MERRPWVGILRVRASYIKMSVGAKRTADRKRIFRRNREKKDKYNAPFAAQDKETQSTLSFAEKRNA